MPHDANPAALQTQLRLFDTATHSVTAFSPLIQGQVRIYVCGATVQSSPHIGHMRAAVAFDIIRRWLLKLDFDVVFVRNVTDIDDKILAKAQARGEQWWARAYRYEREFSRAYDLLGVLPPTYEPRATGHMLDMISLVQRLIARGHAYIIPNTDGSPSGNVYFDVPSWPEYGALTHQESGTQAGTTDAEAAIADKMGPSVDAAGSDKYNPADPADEAAGKHNPRDFALWKAAKVTEPATAAWDAPFGKGRPGWHLECSAMAHRYLGADFDIHGGGLDLRFPHHENEMAQSRAAGWGFAHRWMHSAWVTQSGEKMSKSLGNGLSVDAVLEDHSAWVTRYALASVHYRSMLEWSSQTLAEAESAYARISRFITAAAQFSGGQPSDSAVVAVAASQLPEAFVAAMNDDINVSNALASVFSTIREGNSLIGAGNESGIEAGADTNSDSSVSTSSSSSETDTAAVLVSTKLLQVRGMLATLGLDPLAPQWAGATAADSTAQDALGALVSQQIEARAAARANKDFSTADSIRETLSTAGIEIEDNAEGTTWRIRE